MQLSSMDSKKATPPACVHMLLSVPAIEYYVDRGSHVFATFIDFTKAFDRVNYWILFNQLLDDDVHFNFVRLLVYWYTNQQSAE